MSNGGKEVHWKFWGGLAGAIGAAAGVWLLRPAARDLECDLRGSGVDMEPHLVQRTATHDRACRAGDPRFARSLSDVAAYGSRRDRTNRK